MAVSLEFKAEDKQIGLSIRTSQPGPEADLVNGFLERYKTQLGTRKTNYALFYEPCLPMGYPDIVAVAYNPRTYESWDGLRTRLTIHDLKVLHHLYFEKRASSFAIEQKLGIGSQALLRTLERLLDASLIRRTKCCWIPKALGENYGIRRIISIEAKMSDWSGVLKQAYMNRFFSTESFALTPVRTPSSRVIEEAGADGIGIYSFSERRNIQKVRDPDKKYGLPLSYTSWLFNEWIGRRLFNSREVGV